MTRRAAKPGLGQITVTRIGRTIGAHKQKQKNDCLRGLGLGVSAGNLAPPAGLEPATRRLTASAANSDNQLNISGFSGFRGGRREKVSLSLPHYGAVLRF